MTTPPPWEDKKAVAAWVRAELKWDEPLPPPSRADAEPWRPTWTAEHEKMYKRAIAEAQVGNPDVLAELVLFPLELTLEARRLIADYLTGKRKRLTHGPAVLKSLFRGRPEREENIERLEELAKEVRKLLASAYPKRRKSRPERAIRIAGELVDWHDLDPDDAASAIKRRWAKGR